MKQVIGVDEGKCVNCYSCIAACPVKYCMDGSGDVLKVNHEMCIGCGACIAACTHKARYAIDDTESFISDVKTQKMLAIVAPAAVSTFPDSYKRLNGFLKSLGVEAVFDVSFGAELTVQSYMKYLADKEPGLVIAQPCPAIVTYLEIYRPKMLQYLAPAHSPMLHTIAFIRAFEPQYKDYKIAVLSPCIAKPREFEETGLGDYSVTFSGLRHYLDTQGIDLSTFPEVEFTGPGPERAVNFCVPGGLLKTAERMFPGISQKSRKIEGVHTIYPYFKELEKEIAANKRHPLLVDCLSCMRGCAGGPGSGNAGKSLDELEFPVQERESECIKKYSKKWKKRAAKKYDRMLAKYWKDGIYTRIYNDRSSQNTIKKPTEAELEEAYRKMHKKSEKDFYDCGSCGYGSCHDMAVAIFNGLNKPENCHHYDLAMVSEQSGQITELNAKMKEQLKNSLGVVDKIRDLMNGQADRVEKEASAVSGSIDTISAIVDELKETSGKVRERFEGIQNIAAKIETGKDSMTQTINAVNGISKDVDGITDATKVISGIAADTNLLSMNAAIEAAHAGSAGAGFAVVADEIRKLSDHTRENSGAISKILDGIVGGINQTAKCSDQTNNIILAMDNEVKSFATMMDKLSTAFESLAQQSEGIDTTLQSLQTVSDDVKNNQDSMMSMTDELEKTIVAMT